MDDVPAALPREAFIADRRAERPARSRQRPFYGWYILALFWLILATNLAFPMYGSGVISSHMAEALGMNGKELGLSFSIFMAMLGLPAPLIAMGIARFGLRPAFAVGSLLIAGGAFAMATIVDNALGAALAFGTAVALGVAMSGNIATQIGIGRWFVRRRSLALAIMFSANGIGGLIAPPLLEAVIARNGDWRSGWWIIGCLALVMGALATLVARDRPEDVGQFADGGTRETARKAAAPARVHITAWDFTFAQALRTAALWLIVAAIMANFLGLSLVLSHGVPNLRSLGHSPAAAALAVSMISGGTLAGKLMLGIHGDRIEPRLLWAVSSAMIGLGLLAAPFAASTGGMMLYALPFGIGFGGALVMQTAILLNYFGLRLFGTLIGLALFAQTLLGALTPFVAGWLFDRLGSYLFPFAIAGAVNLAAAAILVFVRPPAPSVTPEAESSI